MRTLAVLAAVLNLYLGTRCLLNALHILHTSKYSQASTVVFTMLFLGFGALGLYYALMRHDGRTGLLVGVGPWVLAGVVLFVTMMTSRYP